MRVALVIALLASFLLAQTSKPAPPVVDASDPKNPVADILIGKNSNKRYFLIGPEKDAPVPKDGHRLLVVLPGGDGSASFMPFVRSMRAEVLGKDYLVAQPVAAPWTPNQEIVWPSKLSPVPKMEFTTEDLVAEVIGDVAKRHKVDKRHVFALGWSSSGHVVYSLALADKPLITGAYVAMAVFKPKQLPPIGAAKGRAFFLDHSPEDTTCPFKDAETARDALTKAGAKVELVSYAGGHGWLDLPYVRLAKGIKFLEDAVKKAR